MCLIPKNIKTDPLNRMKQQHIDPKKEIKEHRERITEYRRRRFHGIKIKKLGNDISRVLKKPETFASLRRI